MRVYLAGGVAFLLLLSMSLPGYSQPEPSAAGLRSLEQFKARDLPGLEEEVQVLYPSLSLHAEQLVAENIDRFPRGGPDAVAGLGDWLLSNGELCAAVSGVEHDAGIVRGGGSLVDFYYCDQPNDQWTYANLLTGLAKETAIPVQQISSSVSDKAAEVVAVGERDGLRQTVTFRLRPEADELEMDVLIARNGSGDPLRISGLFTLYSQRTMTPFSLSSHTPEASLGFQQRAIDRSDMGSLIAGLMPADWNILVGGNDYDTHAAYGVQLKSAELIKPRGARQQLPRFLAVFPDYSLHGWLSKPLWIQSEKLNWLSMLQNQFMDLKKGERLLAKFVIRLGKRSDVAAITDQIYQGPQLRGYSNRKEVSFSVWDQYERPLTQMRPGDDGSFNIRLPESVRRVHIVATAPWGETISRDLTIADARNDSGRWHFRQNGRLALPKNMAMSLYFSGIGETEDPVFGDDLLGFRIDGEASPGQQQRNRIDLAGVNSDPATIDLPPGQYRVLVTRGIEYRVQEYLLTVVEGKTSQLPLLPPRRFWFSNEWRSADLHVHSGASFDANLPIAERLRSFVAQGTEILVAAEHNRIVDQSQKVKDMGLTGQLQYVVGSELTGLSRGPGAPYTIGHSNVFPMVAAPKAFAGGLPKVENLPLRRVIASAKERDPGSLFQLNHPRSKATLDRDLAFFEHLSIGKTYDPKLPLENEANRSLLEIDPVTGARDLDFDLLEVLNGSEMDSYEAVRTDWFSLLNQGYKRTATGNSDSHGLRQIVALPRNYVYLPDAGPLPIDEKRLTQALAEGRSFITSGPLLELTLRDAAGRKYGIGDTFKGSRASLDIQIDAAPWVDVDSLTVWVNGVIYRQLPVKPGDHKVIEVVVEGDSWLVVEVAGQPGEIYQLIAPDLRPLAVSNPLYFDGDADGEWHPLAQ
jgi:hypothetical protein